MIDKTKNEEDVPNLEVIEDVLVQCNLVDNQYVLCQINLLPILLNIERSNLVFLKIYNTEFDKTIKTFTGQNGRPLEIEDRVNLALLINK